MTPAPSATTVPATSSPGIGDAPGGAPRPVGLKRIALALVLLAQIKDQPQEKQEEGDDEKQRQVQLLRESSYGHEIHTPSLQFGRSGRPKPWPDG